MIEMKRILVVEDDPHDLELTLTALEDIRLANEVDVVRDGAEALDYLFRRGAYADRPTGLPALILLDLKLPKVDGTEVLQAVREDSRARAVPVVIFTSSNEERDVIASYRLGTNAYVVKPLDYQQFLQVIRELGTFWGIVNEPPTGCKKRR